MKYAAVGSTVVPAVGPGFGFGKVKSESFLSMIILVADILGYFSVTAIFSLILLYQSENVSPNNPMLSCSSLVIQRFLTVYQLPSKVPVKLVEDVPIGSQPFPLL